MWDTESSLVASHLNQSLWLFAMGRSGTVGMCLNSWTVAVSLTGYESSVFGMRDPPVFIPTPGDRYRQILLPALRLCQVILTSSMAQHLQAAGQVRGALSAENHQVQKLCFTNAEDGPLT